MISYFQNELMKNQCLFFLIYSLLFHSIINLKNTMIQHIEQCFLQESSFMLKIKQ